MITPFNRKELCITYSAAEQAALRDALAKAGIAHRVAVRRSGNYGHLGADRAFADAHTAPGTHAIEYVFYVHRQAYSDAERAICEVRRRFLR